VDGRISWTKSKSIISNCSSNNVTISGSSTDIGGIAGRNENSSSTNSK
jgi:hypothetical protein